MTDSVLPLPQDAMYLKGHTKTISEIVMLRGGEQIVTASWDGTARVFSLSSAECVHSFQGPKHDVNSVDVIDDDTIITASDDNNVRVWRLSDGKLIHTKALKQKAACCKSLQKARLLIGGGNGALYELQWTGSHLTTRRTLPDAHSGWIRRISVHNGLFATASTDKTVKLWNASKLKHIHTFAPHDNGVLCVALNDQYVVTGWRGNTLRVHDAHSFRFVRSIDAHDDWIRDVRFVHGGKAVLSGSDDKSVAVHALGDGACCWRMRVGFGVRGMVVCEDGRVVVGGGRPFDAVVLSTSLGGGGGVIEGTGRLVIAFAGAIADPAVLDEAFLEENVCAGNVVSVADLLAGHNLILLAIRVGVITRENIRRFGGSSWYLKDNLYLPATKIGQQDPQLIQCIFQHAESLGIISGGYALKIAQEIRVDVATGTKAVVQAIAALSERVTALEKRVLGAEKNIEQLNAALVKMNLNQRTLQDAIRSLSRNLTDLKAAMRRQDQRMKYAGIARCLLTFIPLVGNALGNAAYSATELFASLTADDLVPVGVDGVKAAVTEMAQVDLSNFQVAQYVFSKDSLAKLETPAKDAVMQAISASSFQTLQVLQSSLHEQIATTGSSDPSAAFLDIGSSSWLTGQDTAGGASSSSNPPDLDDKAREYFQFLTKTTGSTALTFVKATSELEYLLRESVGLAEVSYEQFEDLFFEFSDPDDEDVTEEVFVRIFRTLRKEYNRGKMMQQLLEECSARFQKHARSDGSLPLRLAARVLRNLCKEMERRGFVKAGSCIEFNAAVRELRRNCSQDDSADSVVEGEFMSTVTSLLKRMRD